jgi:hypothetical protein
MKKLLLPASLAMLALLSLTGCNFSPVVRGDASNPTLGQQLLDLKRAEDAGVITPQQYEAKKAEMLGR